MSITETEDMPAGDVLVNRPVRSRLRRWIRRLCVLGCVVALSCLSIFLYARSRVTAYTSDKPVALPKVQVSKVEMVELENRFEKFSNTREQDSSRASEFLLSVNQVNALIHKEAKLRDKVFVKIVDETLKADVCFPADILPGGEGRFFNAEVTIDLAVVEGKIRLMVKDALVDGSPVPEVWLKLVRDRDFAKPLYNDREISLILANVDEVIVKNEGILFKFHGSANEKQIALQDRSLNHRERVQ